jgi:hypothetical protein
MRRVVQPLAGSLSDQQIPLREFVQRHRLRCAFPSNFSQLLWFSRCIESALHPRNTCLLWFTEFGVFPSNENRHLYYRLRQSYGDVRLLQEAPGHLCLDYESPDVVTLIQLSMLFGWDVHLIPSASFARAFVCHDEWIEIGFDDTRQFNETLRQFKEAELDISVYES